MWPKPLENADLVTFTEEILNENLFFCAVGALNDNTVAVMFGTGTEISFKKKRRVTDQLTRQS